MCGMHGEAKSVFARHEHDLLQRLALGVEEFRTNIRPPEALKMGDRRVLGEVLLIPASSLAHRSRLFSV